MLKETTFKADGRTIHYRVAPSLREAIAPEYLALPRTAGWDDSSVSNAAKREWDFGAGFDTAVSMARHGWPEGAQKLLKSLSAVPADDSAPTRRYAVEGFAVNVGRAMSGNPLSMRQKSRDKGQRKAITLLVNIGASSGQSAEAMSTYGLAITAYVEQLERQNIPCEVIAYIYSTMDKRGSIQGWTVKRANEAFNVSDMAFSLGHTAAMRRLCFALLERSGCKGEWGYGYPAPMPADIIARQYPGAIPLNGMLEANSIARTIESAQEYLELEINKAREV